MVVSFLQTLFKALQLLIRNKALIRIPIQQLLKLWTYVTGSLISLGSSIGSRGRKASSSVDPAAEKNRPESIAICASELPSDSVSDSWSESRVDASATRIPSNNSSGTNFDPQSCSHSDTPYVTANEGMDGSQTSTASLAASVSRLSTTPRVELSPHRDSVTNDTVTDTSQVSVPTINMVDRALSPSQGYNLPGDSAICPTQESDIALAGEAVQLTGPGLCATYDPFYAFLPERFGRYDRPDIIPSQMTTYELPMMTVRFEEFVLTSDTSTPINFCEVENFL
ncbi:hypothetical protein VNI00_018596 [Paramarasmius palmivorus]|uniref:Uncharacterized protein n=1 Tax=Paramarasmius palmivorus TaxID=297713 RepID=A0AAW0AXS0_9AGAR